ncbi:MAG TPA: 50S ribosomal protein L17 [Catalimonadaceae bacterium]|nr:50S ribosomal protein L17 [Catalimonadaceae bacterium]HPI12266.1 50S ribosomal protein L17 [Catalimonadaceae bacterium]
MRHGKKNNHLGRTAPHRKSMLSNMANSLIINKRIVTTVAKAKELRKYVEPLLTKSKEDTTHNRRIVFSYLKSKESIKALFGEVSEKIATRNGGYTRIIKLGTRQGDAAETAMIELVDYNDLLMASTAEAPAKAKRTRRAGSKKADGVAAAPAAEVIQDAVVVDEPIAAAPVADEPIVDEVATSTEDAPETDNEASPDDEPAAQA